VSARRPSAASTGPSKDPSADQSAAADDQLFRDAVARLRATERRRLFPLSVHVGVPDGAQRGLELAWPVPEEYDAGLRFDVVDALAEGLLAEVPALGAAWGWVVRPGVPQPHDQDLAWFAAVSRVFAAHELTMKGFRAVTRTGWLDVVTGESRTWKRLRS
jgi:hypothetical protein